MLQVDPTVKLSVGCLIYGQENLSLTVHSQKTNTLSLQIYNKSQAGSLVCVAIQGDAEISCIVQRDAELLKLNPAEKVHVLRWTMIDPDGVPGTMRSSAFQVVPDQSINKNVILGRDWQTSEALANSATRPDTQPTRLDTQSPRRRAGTPSKGQWHSIL
jgi:hypothetical protein